MRGHHPDPHTPHRRGIEHSGEDGGVMSNRHTPATRTVGRIRYNTRYLAREAAAGTVAHIGSDARALMLAMNDQRRAPEMTERDRSALLARAAVLRERISSFEEQLNGLIESDPQAEYLPTGEGNPEPGPVDDAGVCIEGEQGVGHVADAGGLLGVAAIRVPKEGDVSGGELFPDLLDVDVADVPAAEDAFLQLVRDVVNGGAEFRVQFVPLPLGDEVDGLAHGASPSKDGAEPGQASTVSVEGDPAARVRRILTERLEEQGNPAQEVRSADTHGTLFGAEPATTAPASDATRSPWKARTGATVHGADMITRELAAVSDLISVHAQHAAGEVREVRIDDGRSTWEHDGVTRVDVTDAAEAIAAAERTLRVARSSLVSLVGQIDGGVVQLDGDGVSRGGLVMRPCFDAEGVVGVEHRGQCGVDDVVAERDGDISTDPEGAVVGAEQEAEPLAPVDGDRFDPSSGVREHVEFAVGGADEGRAFDAHGASPSKVGAVPGLASTVSVEGDPAAGAGVPPAPAVRALGSDNPLTAVQIEHYSVALSALLATLDRQIVDAALVRHREGDLLHAEREEVDGLCQLPDFRIIRPLELGHLCRCGLAFLDALQHQGFPAQHR